MFADYAVVELKRDLPEHGMKAGARGTIVMTHHASVPAYEVELIDERSGKWAVVTLKDDDLSAVPTAEMIHEESMQHS